MFKQAGCLWDHRQNPLPPWPEGKCLSRTDRRTSRDIVASPTRFARVLHFWSRAHLGPRELACWNASGRRGLAVIDGEAAVRRSDAFKRPEGRPVARATL